MRSYSYSGNERNRLFIQSGSGFLDTSSFSNIDFREDGRCFALFDFDADGFLDIGMVSTVRPKFRLMKNEFAQVVAPESANWIKVLLVGGNQTPAASDEYSSRDPIGANIVLHTGKQKRMVKYSSFGGLSNQNSRWVHVGLGRHQTIDRITVQWPSGCESELTDVVANQKVTIHETP